MLSKRDDMRISNVLLPLLLGAFVTACGTTTQIATVREHGGSSHMRIADLPVRFSELKYLDAAAAFSAAVYVDAPRTTPLANAHIDSESDKASLDLLPAAGWTERTDIPRPDVPGTRQTPNLTYRLWVSTDDTPRVAILVFRGTHIPADWISNLRWLDFWLPLEDHYEQTERITPAIVRWIHEQYGENTIMFAAGHSLGGGLAQTAAYASCGDISTVFAFDSSPVTRHRAANNCANARSPNAFYRVFEQSEILSYARFVVRLTLGLRGTLPRMTEVKVHVFSGVAIRGHSMHELAINLREALSDGSADAAKTSR